MEQPPYIHVTGTVVQQIPLPVVPLYDLKLVAQLIPCQLNTLKWRLQHHKDLFQAVYRREGTGRRVRLLSAHEIIKMRSLMLKGPGLAKVLGP